MFLTAQITGEQFGLKGQTSRPPDVKNFKKITV